MKKTIALSALVLCAYFFGMGSYGLIDPDEGRYSEIPREMLETGDYITPRLNYVKYFEKPALHYWLTAASFALFGQNEFAARLTPVLCALGGIVLVYILARRFYGSREAFYSVVILSTCVLWFAVARLNILDMTVTFFITLSLVGFWYGQDESASRAYLLLFYAGMALATLTKGLIGFILPGGIVFWYIILTRRWSLFARVIYWPGVILFLVLTVPWFWAVCRANSDFFYFFFVQEHFLRYTTRMHGRYQPFWFFVPMLIFGLVPWAGLLPGITLGVAEKAKERRAGIFLGLWFAVPFIFFSLSDSKLIPYILPCLPPLAILGGRELTLVAGDGTRARRFVHANGVLSLILAAGGIIYPMMDKKYGVEALYPYTLPASASLTLIALCGWRFYSRRSYRLIVNILCALAFVNILALSRGFTMKADQDSYKEPAALIREHLSDENVVVSYGSAAQGLGFYLGRRIVLAEALGELEFGASQEGDPRWFIGSDTLEKLWGGASRVFLVSDERNAEELKEMFGSATVIGENRYFVVLSNY
ncbi:MAG: glycosyltransferase family 39 protein [Synergistaceae bacterium]|jgi:4-amino-4-deoxy-L-arabinose transferase-like glycosyltransferase|nr:glycosyltransferase family 39 protein [Synergistaceae bacterium]